MSIRQVHDTFIQMLIDSLTGITVKEIRFDASDAQAGTIELNALNVTFLNRNYAIQPDQIQVTLDVCYDNQLNALDVEEQVAKLLQRAAFMQLLDYTNPASPASVPNKTISWKAEVSFRPVVADTYYHSTTTIVLNS